MKPYILSTISTIIFGLGQAIGCVTEHRFLHQVCFVGMLASALFTALYSINSNKRP